MERWAPAPARERPRRRPGQPSFSSTLLDAICDSLDDQPGGPGTTVAAARSAGSAQKKHEAALHCYYYKPSLAASHRAAPAPADDCSGRGYFSSSEVEYSLRRLRPIRTSGGVGAASVAPAEKPQQRRRRRTRRGARGSRPPPPPAAAAAGRPALLDHQPYVHMHTDDVDTTIHGTMGPENPRDNAARPSMGQCGPES